MNWKKEWKTLLLITVIFLIFYFLPLEKSRFERSIIESLHLVKDYAREHVLLCLIPAFFIAGAIGVFLSQAAVMKYLGARAKKIPAYGVASVSGSVLAVCSCTILPLFAGIYKMGAGLGPATAFLYSGPAINVLAIILTARILGPDFGIGRAAGAVIFGIVIGLVMHLIFRREEQEKAAQQGSLPESSTKRTLGQNVIYFACMIGILVFANWGKPGESGGLWHLIYSSKWVITAIFSLFLAVVLPVWFSIKPARLFPAGIVVAVFAFLFPDHPGIAFTAGILGLSVILNLNEGEGQDWFAASWQFAKQILPLLFIGTLIAGLLLGRPQTEGMIPSQWIIKAVGGNSLFANFFASIAGAFMYFATLTEVPILQGLLGAGMGKGPALALLLSGPALSLPNMLVIRSVMGTKKTLIFVILVIIMATFSGYIFGNITA